MAFSLALVDFDGTLADSMPYWLRLPVDTLREADLPQPEGFAEYIRSVPIWEIARDMGKMYPQLEADTPLAARWSAEMAEYYARAVPLKPGAKELLRTLRAAGLGVYILSATRCSIRPLSGSASRRSRTAFTPRRRSAQSAPKRPTPFSVTSSACRMKGCSSWRTRRAIWPRRRRSASRASAYTTRA